MKAKTAHRVMLALEYHGLGDVELEKFESRTDNVARVSCYKPKLTAEQFRQVKKVFGPMKLRDSYGIKDLRGELRLTEDLVVEISVDGAYSCQKVEPAKVAEWTEEQWAEYKSRAREGLVDITVCEERQTKEVGA